MSEKIEFTKEELEKFLENYIVENLDIKLEITQDHFNSSKITIKNSLKINKKLIAASSDNIYLN